jgi:hypothetical protein
MAQILEGQGDADCAAKNWSKCQDAYSLALSTQVANPAVMQKYTKALNSQK